MMEVSEVNIIYMEWVIGYYFILGVCINMSILQWVVCLIYY